MCCGSACRVCGVVWWVCGWWGWFVVGCDHAIVKRDDGVVVWLRDV